MREYRLFVKPYRYNDDWAIHVETEGHEPAFIAWAEVLDYFVMLGRFDELTPEMKKMFDAYVTKVEGYEDARDVAIADFIDSRKEVYSPQVKLGLVTDKVTQAVEQSE